MLGSNRTREYNLKVVDSGFASLAERLLRRALARGWVAGEDLYRSHAEKSTVFVYSAQRIFKVVFSGMVRTQHGHSVGTLERF